MTRVKLTVKVEFMSVKLVGVNSRQAKLNRVKLTRVDLVRAKLVGVKFSG